MHIEITLTSGCPMMCSYCPQGNYIKAYKASNQTDKKKMTLEDYKIILKNIGRTVRDIHFTGFTEPLTNPEWYEIVKHTIECGHTASMNTILFGASSEDVDKLTGLKIPIRIHLTDSKQEVSQDILKEFSTKYYQEIKFDYFSAKGKSLIPEDERGAYHEAHSRGGNLEEDDSPVKTYSINGPVICKNNRYYSNVVLPNGDVSVCCSDFGLDHILGNLLREKLSDIHSSQKIKDFIEKMSEGDENFICNKCFYAKPV